ncbi:MAG: polymer-forming cytoskeletal protein [Dongiaceae bacterium]
MAPPPENPKVSAKNLAPTIISSDLRIKGDVIGSGDIQIDGIVEGDVHSRSITVGEGAEVRGSLSADTVRVYGTVSGGTIKATTVTLAKSAKVHSDIVHQTMALEAGAYLEGSIKRIDGVDPKMALVGKDKPAAAPAAPAAFTPSPSPFALPGAGPSPVMTSPMMPSPVMPSPIMPTPLAAATPLSPAPLPLSPLGTSSLSGGPSPTPISPSPLRPTPILPTPASRTGS